MRYFFYLILTLLFLSSSCRKEPASRNTYSGSDSSTTAEGTVVDATDGKPIPYAQTFLTKDNGNTWSSWGIKTVDSKRAGPDGKFSYTFKAEEDYYYNVYAEANNYTRYDD